MYDTQIMSGFMDIKSELLNKHKFYKQPKELYLWFSYSAPLLIAHDYDVHQKSLIVALSTTSKSWKVLLPRERPGANLVRYACNKKNSKGADIVSWLNKEFRAKGTYSVRFLK